MKRSINISEELNQLNKTVAGVPFVNVYTLPADYFAKMQNEILLKINKKDVYGVPDGYFEQLNATVLNKIHTMQTEEQTDELSLFAPTLASIPRKNVYAVPDGYFDRLQINKKEAKVIAIGTSKKKFVWIRYAVAACTIGVISLLAFNFFDSKNVAKEDRIIAGTNVTYNQIKNLDIEQELEKISGAEMDTYLCDNGLIACNNDKDSDLVSDLEKLNMTDEELESLLDETNN